MKVRDVIDKCIELLPIDCEKDDLLTCFNIVEGELSLDYFPLYATHKCDAKTVYYADFEYNPIRIVDCNCKFKIYPQYIEAKNVITEVKYTYFPKKKDIYSECEYDEKYFNCLVYGTISEYLISQGFYEEADLWNRKYKKQIQELYEVKE